MVYDEVFTPDFYSQLNNFRMNLKMKLAAGSNGGRKSNSKGSSVEFSDFREYIPGDDIRRIDWNAYGRFDRFFVKLFMEEKEGIFRIYLDSSESMNYGQNNKMTFAKRVAAAFSYCILDNSDRVVLNVLSNEGMKSFSGITGKQGFSKLIDNLSLIKASGKNDMLFSFKKHDIKSRGVSVIISDFYTDKLEDVLKYLTSKKQEIILVQILSEEEIEPFFEGTAKLIDLEEKSSIRATYQNSLIKDYKKSYTSFVTEIDRLCKKYQAKYIRLSSSEEIDKILRG